MTSTIMANNKTIPKNWFILDAAGKPLGRVASEAAKLLVGKHKPEYTPHIDSGDYVIVLNVKDMVLTGNKLYQEYVKHHSGYPGGLKKESYKDLMKRNPEKIFYEAVKGMLPKNKLGRKMIKKLKVYAGSEHVHQAQKPKVWEFDI